MLFFFNLYFIYCRDTYIPGNNLILGFELDLQENSKSFGFKAMILDNSQKEV